jgi:hypothetical protein
LWYVMNSTQVRFNELSQAFFDEIKNKVDHKIKRQV